MTNLRMPGINCVNILNAKRWLIEKEVLPYGNEGRDIDGNSLEAHEGNHRQTCMNWCSHFGRGSSSDVAGSLPQSYSTIVTALEVRVDNLNIPFVQQALIHEEHKKSVQAGDTALHDRI